MFRFFCFKAEAKARLSKQMANSEYVSEANVVFCTLWDPEYTQSQVEKAWMGLRSLIPGL